MLLKEVHIIGFWNKYNLDWYLNESVNILSGINGAGKTTLLDVIYALMKNWTEANCLKKISRAKLLFSEGYSIEYEKELTNGKQQFTYKKDDAVIEFDDFHRNIRIGAIATFDANMPSLEEYQKFIVTRSDKIRSELDWMVERIMDIYYKYINSISQEVENAIKQNKLDTLAQYYRKKTEFLQLMNELFSSTHKSIFESENGLQFKLNDETVIPPNELSSGEKQLLILMIFSLAQRELEFITFWDEPEISLHIDWQRMLIRTIRKLNPNGQLIISTHSPSIIYEGWEKMVINMEDLLK